MTFIRSLLYAVWFYLTMAVIGLICMPVSIFSRARLSRPDPDRAATSLREPGSRR